MGDSNDTSVKLITLDNLETYHGLMDTKKEEHSVELTQAQYDALSPAEKMNGKTYYITDADPEYGSGYATADSVAPVEENSTSSADYAVDDYIYRSGKLYKVIAAISIGDSFVVNTNIRETRISDEFGSGGDPESVDYNSVENKPQINGVTLSGNKTGSDLGLVNAESGKGLSTNDYTTAEKTKLTGITTGANKKHKKLYTLTANTWQASQSDYGVYTYRLTISDPYFDINEPINVYFADRHDSYDDPYFNNAKYKVYKNIYDGEYGGSVEDYPSQLVLYYYDPINLTAPSTTINIYVEGIVKEWGV